MRFSLALWVAVGSALSAQAQLIITSQDMFNQIGQYYRAYSSPPPDPLDANAGAAVGDKIGNKGSGQLWDFSKGPTNTIYRFDYVAVDDGGHGTEFPDAKFAERKTTEATGEQEWLYLEQVPGVGRRVFGFYNNQVNPEDPSQRFPAPIIDFPNQIKMGDSWTTSTRYEIDLAQGLFPEPIIGAANTSSEFKVDAEGLLILPGVGFDQALRVSELAQTTIEGDLDGDGTLDNLGTQFHRTYYWLRPNMGIAAMIVSRPGASPPPESFQLATQFVRLFETNKEAAAPCENPDPVSVMNLTLGSAGALLNWETTECTTSYRVEYTDNPGNNPWKELTTTQSNFTLDTTVRGVRQRFYRIISIK